MNLAAEIQNAINYIEENITDELDFAEISKRASCSTFYFQRIFSALCGCTLGEYIRSRRLTLAGYELVSEHTKVIDVALKYGYDSPESFTRAFVKFHHITPSQAKKDGRMLRSFSRVSVQIILKGGNLMNYKVEKKDAFKVLEKVEKHSIDDSQNKNTIPEFWMRSHTDGTVQTLLKQTNDTTFLYGICYNNAPKSEKALTFDYSIASLYGGGEIPEGFSVREIPARTWLVFECIGPLPDSVQNTWHKICTEFFPTSNYKPTYEMDIEAYMGENMNNEKYYSEIWIPVEK